MKLVVGLGSPFLSDDGVGPRVVRELERQGCPGVGLIVSHAGGLSLIEQLEGTERAVIVDALVDRRRRPGEVLTTHLEAATRNASCSHDCSLAEALAVGRALGMNLPPDEAIHLVAIVAGDVTTFGERLTQPVAEAVERACLAIRAIIDEKTPPTRVRS